MREAGGFSTQSDRTREPRLDRRRTLRTQSAQAPLEHAGIDGLSIEVPTAEDAAHGKLGWVGRTLDASLGERQRLLYGIPELKVFGCPASVRSLCFAAVIVRRSP